ncbi:MAG TPA: GNAT family N-acetyltransferase [Blastocatellia bacterium]|nr:GNAT family N-acetyltransferase [Blastocatellia bacterium]
MDKTAFTSLESERLRLRRFTESDLLPFLAYLNDPIVARYQTWESYTDEQAAKVIEEQAAVEPGEPGKWFTFAAELKDEDLLIGHVALNMRDHQQAEIGFTFARAYQGKGLAFEATCLVLDYLFTGLSLHRVIAIADCENERSVALLKRLGMRQEGHFIQNIWFKGKWGDEYLYAILKDEWLRGRQEKV